MRRLIAIVIISMVAAGALFAGGSQEATGSGQKVVEFGLSGNPDTLDPQATTGTLTFQVDRSIYDTLVEPDAHGKIVPALAESWNVSADGKTWTFHLRHGVVFHNGDQLTSADVKATFERLTSPEQAAPTAKEFSSISSIDTPDPYTVVFHLPEPYAPLLASMASGWGAILPRRLIEAGHDFANDPVGTGPFAFKQWIRDNKIVLEKNPNYWMDGLPLVDGVTFNIITESTVQIQGLVTGRLDIADAVGQPDLEMLSTKPDVKVQRQLSSIVMVMAMNTAHKPLDNLKVRQAINYAVNKESVLDVAYGGGKVVGTFMDYSNPYYVDFTDLYPYDPDKARTLLAEAGVTDTTQLEMVLPQNYAPHVRAGEIYQEMLTKVGLNVKIRLVDWSTWLSDVYRGGNYDLTVIGHTGKLDPDGRLAGYGIPDENYVHWKNERAAQLIEKGRHVIGFEKRQPIYAEVLKIMAHEVPQLYLGTWYNYIGLRANVEGFRMDSQLDTFDLRRVQLK